MLYAAQGSHGLYPDARRHTYKTLPNGDTLNDDTSTGGAQWDTAAALVTFRPQSTYTGSLAWLNYRGRWGNPKAGCGTLESVSGECVLNDGPGSIPAESRTPKTGRSEPTSLILERAREIARSRIASSDYHRRAATRALPRRASPSQSTANPVH